MIEKSYYQDYSREDIRRDLRNRGYTPMDITEAPWTELTSHQHPQKHIIVIQTGSMEVELNDESDTLYSGDAVTIPPRMTHAARFGPEGCTYFWIEQ